MIKPWLSLNYREQITINNVFWETSSKKDFFNQESKDLYYNIWLGYYLLYYPELIFVFIENEVILAYIVGTNNGKNLTFKNSNWILKSEELFFEIPDFDMYSAHLHINALPRFQGRGFGSQLLVQFEQNILIKEKCSGIHLITVKGEENNRFYLKNNYREYLIKKMGKFDLIFYCKEINKIC